MVEITNIGSSKPLIKKQPNNPPISFKGHEINNDKVKFFIPGKKEDEGKAFVSLFKVGGDSAKGIENKPLIYKDGFLSTEVDLDSKDTRYGYNFYVNGKVQTDITQQKEVGGVKFAVTRDPKLTSFEKPHQIYHVVPDSFNPKDQSKVLDENGNFIWRNHFDLYGGNIDGVIEKLDYIKGLGAGRIMGTPIFGDDNVSCHGYWTQNPYQIAQNMGNVNKFDELNLELFKRGMGWIADGAFVNQGLMGVQFQDVLRHAAQSSDESPYTDWFKFYGQPGPDFVLGVLPQDNDGEIQFDKFDINFENAPVDKKGNPQPYDKTKPTYLVLSDPRTAQDANKQISFDSVQKYKFPVNAEELKEKFDYATEFEADGSIAKSELLEWGNFRLDTSDYDSDKLLWDGNRDVLKMNMKNPAVRNYIMGAGTYWTTRVDNVLLKYVSENINKQLAGKEANAENIKDAIVKLEKAGVLPQGSSEISKANIDAAIKNVDIALLHGTLRSAMAAFPVESIELPREVAGVITNPKFKEAYKDLVNSPKFKSVVDKIVKSSNISDENKQKLSQPETLRLVANEIARAVMTKAISNVDYMPGQELPADWKAQLADGAAKHLPAQIFQASNDVAVSLMLDTIKNYGLPEVKVDEIAAKVNEQLSNVSVPTVRAAKALLGQMESGLDWRIDAAKDVADMDGVRNGRVDKKDAFEFVNKFWAEFCDKVRTVNPKAFIIGEVTDVPDKDLPNFLQSDGFSTLSNYRYMFGTPYKFVHAHPEVMGWHDGPTPFFKELENFAKAWPVTAVNSAHNMVDNHDKTRVLQNLLLHPGEFKDKGAEKAMAALLKYALCRAYNVDKDSNTLEKVKKSDKTFAKVFGAIDKTAKTNGENFGYWSMERAIDAVMKTAGVEDKATASKMSKVLFDDATDKYIRALYLLVGVPGAPEIYAGTEFAMTGGETISKNVYNQNRNPIPWVWLNGKNARSEVVDFNNKVKSIFNLRNNNQLRALNDGFVKDLGHKDDENGVLAFLRYNADQQAIVLLNNGKVNQSGNASNVENSDPKWQSYDGNLPVTQKAPLQDYKVNVGQSGIGTGTVFANAENQNDKYIVWSDGNLRKKPDGVNNASDVANYSGQAPEGLTLGQGMILFREDAAAQKPEVSFKGLKRLNRIV